MEKKQLHDFNELLWQMLSYMSANEKRPFKLNHIWVYPGCISWEKYQYCTE